MRARGSSGELQDLTPERLVRRATPYGMEVSTEKKSKIMTNSTNNISVDITVNSQKLEEVTSFKTPGSKPVQGLAPAQQKSASGLPQQWQQWPD